jgi:hypothetical protein
VGSVDKRSPRVRLLGRTENVQVHPKSGILLSRLWVQ